MFNCVRYKGVEFQCLLHVDLWIDLNMTLSIVLDPCEIPSNRMKLRQSYLKGYQTNFSVCLQVTTFSDVNAIFVVLSVKKKKLLLEILCAKRKNKIQSLMKIQHIVINILNQIG